MPIETNTLTRTRTYCMLAAAAVGKGMRDAEMGHNTCFVWFTAVSGANRSEPQMTLCCPVLMFSLFMYA